MNGAYCLEAITEATILLPMVLLLTTGSLLLLMQSVFETHLKIEHPLMKVTGA